jgi:hypothetical protein
MILILVCRHYERKNQTPYLFIRLLTKPISSKTEDVMKTLKCVLLTALFAVAMIGGAMAGEDTKVKAKPQAVKGNVVKITYEKAIQIPGLLSAMNAQLDKSLISEDKPFYVARVCYAHRLYLISGSQDQWKRFFKMHFRAKIEPVLIFGTD